MSKKDNLNSHISRRDFLKSGLALGIFTMTSGLFGKSVMEVFAADGELLTPTKLLAPFNTLLKPMGLGLTPNKHILIADSSNYAIFGFKQGKASFGISGIGSKPAFFNFPKSILVTDTHLFVADSNNGRIQIFYLDSVIRGSAKLDKSYGNKGIIGELGPTPGKLYDPQGMCIYKNRLYVADCRNHRVQAFELPSGKCVLTAGSLGDDKDQLRLPTDVAVTDEGIFVISSKHHCIKIYNHNGTYSGMLGVQGKISNEESLFDSPTGIASDKYGRIYIADTGNKRIQAFSAGGTFIKVIGEDKLEKPIRIVIDKNEQIYVLDANIKGVLQFSAIF